MKTVYVRRPRGRPEIELLTLTEKGNFRKPVIITKQQALDLAVELLVLVQRRAHA